MITAPPARLAIPLCGGFGVACAALEGLCRQLAAEVGPKIMAKNFKELRAKLSPEARAASVAEAERLGQEEMTLHELRRARELTQTKLADELQIGQGDVSKLERRTDMYVSTLAGYLEAVGARLEIRAVFPDGRTVRIKQFSE